MLTVGNPYVGGACSKEFWWYIWYNICIIWYVIYDMYYMTCNMICIYKLCVRCNVNDIAWWYGRRRPDTTCFFLFLIAISSILNYVWCGYAFSSVPLYLWKFSKNHSFPFIQPSNFPSSNTTDPQYRTLTHSFRVFPMTWPTMPRWRLPACLKRWGAH